jgi:hypothetical protein
LEIQLLPGEYVCPADHRKFYDTLTINPKSMKADSMGQWGLAAV